MNLLQLFADVEPLSGGGGWLGAGLLGAVLAWLLFVYLPSRDKRDEKVMLTVDTRFKDLLDKATAERKEDRLAADAKIEIVLKSAVEDRDRDRLARHGLAETFQKAIFEQYKAHEEDAEKNRLAFERRHDSLVTALGIQTAELKAAIERSGCRYYPPRIREKKKPLLPLPTDHDKKS